MLRDERGLMLSTDSPEAAQLFDRAVEHFLKYRADVMSVVGRMLAADPDFVMGHCFEGYMLLGASNPAHRPAVAEAVKAAEAGAAIITERGAGMSRPSLPGRAGSSTNPSQLWWHRALMELELGELDWVLESYDTNIRNLDEPMTKATQTTTSTSRTLLLCSGGSNSWASMSATAGANWPKRPRRASAIPAICC